MTLTKAIEILTDCLNIGTEEATPDVNNAIRLGIEALKYYQQERERRGAIKTMWLPGETGE